MPFGEGTEGAGLFMSLHLNFLHGFFVSGALLSLLIVGLHPAMRLLCVCLLGSPSWVGEGCAATCAPRATCCRPLPPLHRQRAEGAASVRKGNHGSHALQLVLCLGVCANGAAECVRICQLEKSKLPVGSHTLQRANSLAWKYLSKAIRTDQSA